jgi:hypothetical protein
MISSAFAAEGGLHKTPRILKFWEEVIGPLHHLTPDEGGPVAVIGQEVVLLPPELDGELRPYIGMRIGILRTDSATDPYRIRVYR